MEAIDFKLIEECVRSTPLALLNASSEIQEQANKFLPYSTGFEIECDWLPIHDSKLFNKIPDIMANESSDSEKRFRIPNGLRGMICLFNICYLLPRMCSLNYGSGIHYHVDMTDVKKSGESGFYNLTKEEKEDILKLLDPWGATYNRSWGTWIRWNSLGTIEIRVGEMSFDYKVLINRIIEANKIAIIIRKLMHVSTDILQPFQAPNKEVIIRYLKESNYNVSSSYLYTQIATLEEELKKINTPKPENKEDVQQIIKSRVKKLK